ncbi:hypothetical protein TELCIR_22821, partial [Teladorsagia circumcincta]
MLMALNVPVLTIVLLLITAETSAQDYVEEELCDIETKSPCSAKEHEECRPQNAHDKSPLEFTLEGPSVVQLPVDSAQVKVTFPDKGPGQGSVDDDKIVAFKWTQDKGPSIPLGAMNTPILTLDNMVAGSYVFSVQVTDSGGLTSSASARVEIEAERDDPPKAHINECGSKEHTGSLT